MGKWIGVLLCAVVLGGCGGGTEPPGPSGNASTASAAAPGAPAKGTVDACALVTTEDLAAALPNVPFAAPERSGRPGGPGEGTLSSCAWTRADDTTESTSIAEMRAALERATTVTVMAWAWPDATGAAAYVRSFVDAGMGTVEAVDGLGDEAIRLAGSTTGVHWRSGTMSASVVVSGRWLDDAARREAELLLARRAQARL